MSTVPRIESWPEALSDYLESRRNVPFTWGECDCATFAAGAVEAITGLGSLDIPRVTSAEAYAHFVRDHGSLRYHVEDRLGEPLPSPAFAQRGDVVLLDIGGRETLGVCCGAEAAVPGSDGMLMVSMTIAVAAWRV